MDVGSESSIHAGCAHKPKPALIFGVAATESDSTKAPERRFFWPYAHAADKRVDQILAGRIRDLCDAPHIFGKHQWVLACLGERRRVHYQIRHRTWIPPIEM